MKTAMFFFVLSLVINFAKAQVNRPIAIAGTPIEMLFHQGKSKALILSLDDGRSADRHMVQLIKRGLLIAARLMCL